MRFLGRELQKGTTGFNIQERRELTQRGDGAAEVSLADAGLVKFLQEMQKGAGVGDLWPSPLIPSALLLRHFVCHCLVQPLCQTGRVEMIRLSRQLRLSV